MLCNQKYLDNLNNALDFLLRKDKRVVLLGEDILDPYGGAFKVTKGLSTKYPGRILATPICEASIIGVGAGLAMRGFRPIVEIMFGDFITIAADQIINHVSKFALMYANKVKVPIVIRTPVGAGRGYGPTHSQNLEKIFLGIPNLNIIAPSHFHKPGDELIKATYDENPVIFLESKLLYPVNLFLKSSKLFKKVIKGEGSNYDTIFISNYFSNSNPIDVVLIAYGGVSRYIEELMIKMADEEIWVLAVFPSCISKLPMDKIIPLVRKSGRVVVIEEGTIGFSWSTEIAKNLYEALFNGLKSPIACIGAFPSVIPASYELEKQLIVNEEKIEKAIMEVLEW